jgi:hypothetical protein
MQYGRGEDSWNMAEWPCLHPGEWMDRKSTLCGIKRTERQKSQVAKGRLKMEKKKASSIS